MPKNMITIFFIHPLTIHVQIGNINFECVQFLPPKLKKKKKRNICGWKDLSVCETSRYCKIKQHSRSSLPFDVLRRQMLKSHIHSPQYLSTQPYIFHEVLSCRALVRQRRMSRKRGWRVAYKRKCAGPLRSRNAVAPKGKERRARNLVKNPSNDTSTGTGLFHIKFGLEDLADQRDLNVADIDSFDASHCTSRGQH